MITVYSYRWVPDFAKGLVRDLRVRWALEEAGLEYQEWLIGLGDDQNSPAYRACQPYGQVPVYEEGGLVLFESGAIVLHIGGKSEALLPADPAARARATCWLFSALNTIEPTIQELAAIDLFYTDEAWARGRRPQAEAQVKRRLAELAAALGDKDHLEGEFTVGDLMMATVLRNLRHTDIVDGEPRLRAYLDRCEARPAFQRALRDQLASFEDQAA
ncbi:MAG: glutathione S-transferase family protein [Phenylobacterium sp.]|uniref:glutathione S-transferase family protein n=1 Tax=Phenylobacterium sp. TaxID=1871053 RepID=UPI0012270163|nr:glutathione S-transferase family protein [Phenylobacterium sp.]TAJ74873.1 MAG: glutathione S-transferase family protein [Phenylobacterium sp.]